MKKIFFLFIIVFSLPQIIWADPITDSAKRADSIKAVKAKQDAAKAGLASMDTVRVQYVVKKGDSLKILLDTAKNSAFAKNCDCIPKPVELDKDWGKWFLVLTPLLLFFIVFQIVLRQANGFDLKGALTENETEKKTVINGQYTAANLSQLQTISNLSVLLPATIEVSDPAPPAVSIYRPSISRYIAFITSLVTIILVVCMSSFFIYHYIRTGCPPDFGALTMVLIALGLGVTPYITNRISTAATANKS